MDWPGLDVVLAVPIRLKEEPRFPLLPGLLLLLAVGGCTFLLISLLHDCCFHCFVLEVRDTLGLSTPYMERGVTTK